MANHRSGWTLLAAASLALTLSACGAAAGGGGDDHGQHGGASADADETEHARDDMEAARPAPGAREFAVSATSFEFEPSQLTMEAGEEVAIALTSTDILHDFVVEDGDFHLAAEPGETALGGLRIDEPGTYTVYCSVAGHRDAGMEATLVVG